MLRGDQSLLLVLQFNPRAKFVDSRDYPSFVLVRRSLEEDLRGIDLCASRIHRSGIRNDKQVGIHRGTYHEITVLLVGMLRGFFEFVGCLDTFDSGPVE